MHPISPPDLNWHLKVFTPVDEYAVYLQPGYTITSHFSTIGKDLSPHIRRRWEDFEIFEYAHYIIYLPVNLKEDLELDGIQMSVLLSSMQSIKPSMIQSRKEFEVLPKNRKTT